MTFWPKVWLYGDSITQEGYGTDAGWVAMLADKLQRKCDVINRGFAGYNTRWNRAMMPRLFDRESIGNAKAVVVFLGANDSNTADLNPRQHVPIEEFKENLKWMVEYLESIGVECDKVILVSPPACEVEAWVVELNRRVGGECPRARAKDNLVVAEYTKKCEEAATECGAEFVDLYSAMMAVEDWTTLLRDGLHFSQSGAKLLFQLLWPAVERRTRDLPAMIYPDWDGVDCEHPDASFMSLDLVLLQSDVPTMP